MWNYYWGYTIAQIELLAIDSPIIVYNHKKSGKDSKPKVSYEDVARKTKEWNDKYGKGNNPITLNLGGFV